MPNGLIPQPSIYACIQFCLVLCMFHLTLALQRGCTLFSLCACTFFVNFPYGIFKQSTVDS